MSPLPEDMERDAMANSLDLTGMQFQIKCYQLKF